MLGKIFSQVYNHQGPILVLVYLLDINTEYNKKIRSTYIYLQEHLSFHIHTSSVKRKNTQTYPMVELYAYCFMDKHYVEGVQK